MRALVETTGQILPKVAERLVLLRRQRDLGGWPEVWMQADLARCIKSLCADGLIGNMRFGLARSIAMLETSVRSGLCASPFDVSRSRSEHEVLSFLG